MSNIASVLHPTVIGTMIVSTSIFLTWFSIWHKKNIARTEKERAYVFALLSSAITSLSSLPLVYQLLTNHGNMMDILTYRTWTVVVTAFFMTFLILDLCVGVLFYRNKIGMLTGWIHHITYLFTLTWVIHNQYTSIFVMMCVLEIPTFLLALGSVRSHLRRDYLFATTFFLSRILFHAYAIFCGWKMKPFGPVVNALAFFFPLHCFWFYGFIQQQIRQRTNKTTTTTTMTPKTPKIIKKPILKSKVLPAKYIRKAPLKSIQERRNRTNDDYSSSYLTPSFHQSPPVSVH